MPWPEVEIKGAMPSDREFSPTFVSQLHELFVLRRDVRSFHRDPLPEGTLEELVETVRLAPSVGLSEPWRFVMVDDIARRAAIRENFQHCNADALARYDEDRAGHYARLKLSGLDDAPHHMAVFADRGTPQGHGLGRGTMPEMTDYSVVTAIHTLWLLARARGIGMGWVSILDPVHVAQSLDVPQAWKLIGYFCLGYPQQQDDTPELERRGWERRHGEQPILLRR
jgi:5,6-dimethylbenzimidazole synthase